MINKNNVLKNIKSEYKNLYSAEKKVADFMITNPNEAILMSVADLSNASGVSDATVVRTAKHLGYEGYYQLRIFLTKEVGALSENKNIDSQDNPISFIIKKELDFLRSLEYDENKRNIINSAKLILKSNKVIIIGAGNTIPITMDLDFRLNRLGVKAFSSEIFEYYINYLNNSKGNDVLIVFSKSGMSNIVLKSIDIAKKNGLKIIGITGDVSSLSKKSDFVIYSGENQYYINNIIHGTQSHIGEFLISDILVYLIENLLKDKDAYKRAIEFELDVSDNKI